jgi:hypothetical protein
MEKLIELIGKSKCGVCIEINEHKNYYETIEQHLASYDVNGLNSEIFVKMVELDSCIRIQVYPETPIGFITIYHYDLEQAINLAIEEIKK